MKQLLRIFILFFLAAIISLAVHNHGYAQQVDIADILDDPGFFDKKEVIIEAEVIGEALSVESGVWINLYQDDIQIGLFLEDTSALKTIEFFGSYKAQGDIVRIKGIFYKSCPIHAQTGIHMRSLKVLTSGFIKLDAVGPEKEIVLSLSLIICLILLLVYFIKIKYVRRH